jgi:hypothetical protein
MNMIHLPISNKIATVLIVFLMITIAGILWRVKNNLFERYPPVNNGVVQIQNLVCDLKKGEPTPSINDLSSVLDIANEYLSAYENKNPKKVKLLISNPQFVDENEISNSSIVAYEITCVHPNSNTNYTVYYKYTNKDGKEIDNYTFMGQKIRNSLSLVKNEKNIWKVEIQILE